MNQLVGLIVGCVLFFRGIGYFVNISMVQAAERQEKKSTSFTTQSTKKEHSLQERWYLFLLEVKERLDN